MSQKRKRSQAQSEPESEAKADKQAVAVNKVQQAKDRESNSRCKRIETLRSKVAHFSDSDLAFLVFHKGDRGTRKDYIQVVGRKWGKQSLRDLWLSDLQLLLLEFCSPDPDDVSAAAAKLQGLVRGRVRANSFPAFLLWLKQEGHITDGQHSLISKDLRQYGHKGPSLKGLEGPCSQSESESSAACSLSESEGTPAKKQQQGKSVCLLAAAGQLN